MLRIHASLPYRALLLIGLLWMEGGALAVPPVQAQVPTPECSAVPAAIPVSPDGSLAYSVIIRTATCQPAVLVPVTITFDPSVESLLCWCDANDPGPHTFTEYTDHAGRATFHIAAGGCLPRGDSRLPNPHHLAAEVFASQVKLMECGIVSPDAVDDAGHMALDAGGWDPGAGCGVGLSDAVFHTTPLATSVFSYCSDLNGDRAVTLSDGILLTPSLANAASCPRQ